MAASDQFYFDFPGQIVPKARPRVSDDTAYTQANYRDWKDEAVKQVAILNLKQFTHPVAFSVFLFGKHYRNQDSDNCRGAVMDAWVQAGALRKDNWMGVRGGQSFLFYHKKIKPWYRVVIEVLPFLETTCCDIDFGVDGTSYPIPDFENQYL